MSTWNSYTTVLMKSVLVIPDHTNSSDPSTFETEINPYPNPTTGVFKLPMTGLYPSHILLRNINGESIYKTEFTDQIDISSLPPGIYYGSIFGSSRSVSFFKILKTK